MKHELCCIGHITIDKVTTPQKTVFMPGGTSFYVSHAVNNFKDIDYTLVTAVGSSELNVVDEMKMQGLNITVLPSENSTFFENIYGENPDERKQRVWAKGDPFNIEQLREVEANIFHLGALLADDFSLEVVKYLASKGNISVDVQGYLRKVHNTYVSPVDWTNKLEMIPYIRFLKANELEMEALTGSKDSQFAARQLHDQGAKEILLTFGSKGSLIYDGNRFYRIPAYLPRKIVDSTGCGDTYMAGYLYKRAKGAPIEEAARFAAALSSLKIENYGPVKAKPKDVMHVIANNRNVYSG